MTPEAAATRRTEALRYAMTPEDLVGAQLCIWKLERSRRRPGGFRRRGDPKLTVPQHRERLGLTKRDVAARMRCPFSVLERLDYGTASQKQWEIYLPALAAALEVPERAIRI